MVVSLQSLVITVTMSRLASPTLSSKHIGFKETWDWNFLVHRVKWTTTLAFVFLHVYFVYGYFHILEQPVKLWTVLFASVYTIAACIGITASHRHWAHRSFQAGTPLRIFLALCNVSTMNESVLCFARDHRLHHKYSDTPADPRDSSRGMFFAHIGSYLVRKHPMVLEFGKKLDYSDLYADKVIMFEHQYYEALFLIFGVAVPILVPVYGWNEAVLTAFWFGVVNRLMIALHSFYLVNSVTHGIGSRPFDKDIVPTDNRLVNYFTLGEGSHNYHHKFPLDYRSSPFQSYECFQPMTAFLELCKWLGLAWGFKVTARATIEKVVERNGDEEYVALLRRHQQSSLVVRLLHGLLDYLVGLVILLWFLYPLVIFKYINNLPVAVL